MNEVILVVVILAALCVVCCLVLAALWLRDSINAAHETEKTVSMQAIRVKEIVDNYDRYFAESRERIVRRETDLQQFLVSLPKHVDRELQKAISEVVQPYRELQEEMKGKGLAAMPDDELIRFEMDEKQLEESLAKWEAGIAS